MSTQARRGLVHLWQNGVGSCSVMNYVLVLMSELRKTRLCHLGDSCHDPVVIRSCFVVFLIVAANHPLW